MGLFTRTKPRDTSALSAALDRGSYEDFVSAYLPENVHYDGYSRSLLEMALNNSDLQARVQIAHRLLDDGADVRSGHPVHVLVGAARHDFDAEAPLLRRLLDAGADVNLVLAKFGTPLETAAAQFQFSEHDLTPFYDVFLARPDIDFLRPSMKGDPVVVTLRKWKAKRAELVERVEAYMSERGIPVPD